MIIDSFEELEKVGPGAGLTMSTIPGALYIKRPSGLWNDVILLAGDPPMSKGTEVTDSQIWDYAVMQQATISLLFAHGYSAVPNEYIGILLAQTQAINRIIEYLIEKKKLMNAEYAGVRMPVYIEAETVLEIVKEVYNLNGNSGI